jgi:hypothetical protein
MRKRLFCLVLAACAHVHAATTTNFSDQWWVPSESGWGASVLQQKDVLFIDLFVYGPDNRPTWYTAAAFLAANPVPGHVTFTGDLYVTAGPWFGGPFNPAAVVQRRVGTLTFDAGSSDTATLSYAVDGVAVVKAVTRQLWALENFTGNYYGGNVYDLTQCGDPNSNGHFEELGAISITQAAGGAFAMTSQSGDLTCNWTGSYTQAGHMGNVVGTFACSNGINANFTAFELERTISGFSGRVAATDNLGCHIDGRIGGVRR